jgi:L-lactate utilization protein LutC
MGATASTAKRIKPLSADDQVKVLQQQISQLQNELQSCKQQNAKLQQQLESCKQQNAVSFLHGDKQLLSQLPIFAVNGSGLWFRPNIKFGGATFLKLLNFSQNSRS